MLLEIIVAILVFVFLTVLFSPFIFLLLNVLFWNPKTEMDSDLTFVDDLETDIATESEDEESEALFV